MPLVRAECLSLEVRDAISRLQTSETVKAGLYLYFSPAGMKPIPPPTASKIPTDISGTPSCTVRNRTPQTPHTGSEKRAFTRSFRLSLPKRPAGVISPAPPGTRLRSSNFAAQEKTKSSLGRSNCWNGNSCSTTARGDAAN